MIINSIFMTTKTGLKVEFRSAKEDEALAEIAYLRKISGESRFLLNEPEDVKFKEDTERAFLKRYEDDPRALMLNAYVDGVLVGNGSFQVVAHRPRLAHRAEIGIGLVQEFCSRGIGELLMKTLIEKARECGYEMLVLDVYAENTRAMKLYQKLGFKEYGRLENAVKYKDGSYAEIVWMSLVL